MIINYNLAVIVSNLGVGRAAILYGEKSEPVDNDDSGWQFSGSSTGEGVRETAQVWSLHEVIEYEPSLSAYAPAPVGTIITRASPDESWQICSPK